MHFLLAVDFRGHRVGEKFWSAFEETVGIFIENVEYSCVGLWLEWFPANPPIHFFIYLLKF